MSSPGTRHCKDCEPTGKRPAPFPGPRCATHHRARRRQISAAAHERLVSRTYGLAGGQYSTLYDAQGGRCAICQRATGRTKRLAVDHDHTTGEVRGLLCGPCNQYVGYLMNAPSAFDRAAAYLRDPPARRLRRDAVR